MQSFPVLRRLHQRGVMSRGLTVDPDGVMLGPDCVLVRRTDVGYRVVNPVETEAVLRYAFRDRDDISDLPSRLATIARTLEAGDLAKAQILGLQLGFDELGDEELWRLERGTTLVKEGYDPNQPRDDQGRWTSDGGGSATATTSITTPSALPAIAQNAAAGEPALPSSAAVPAPGAPSPRALLALPPAASFSNQAGVAAESDLPIASRLLEAPTDVTVGESAEAVESVLEIAGRVAPKILGRIALPLAILSELLPDNESNIHQGSVPGVNNVSYSSDEGVLTLSHLDTGGNLQQLYFGFPDEDGVYQDDDGNVIGRRIGTKLIFNTEFVTALANGTATVADRRTAASQEQLPTPNSSPVNTDDQPEICPAPSPENIKSRSERSLAYQEQITGLPRGFDVAFHGVRFDGCDPETEHMLEAKGPGLVWALQVMPEWWIRTKWKAYLQFTDQARRQFEAAPDRIIEWHFADKSVADFFRAEFKKYPNIRIIDTEAIVKRYLGWLQAMILMERIDERRLS